MQPASLRAVRRRRITMAIAAIALAACSGPPDKQAKQGLESLHSWAQSANMVGEEWLRGAVPDAYARTALQSFAKKAKKEQKQALSGKLPAATRQFLVEGFGAVILAADSLRSAVDRRDRHGTVTIMGALAARARAVDSVKRQLEAR